ncbi:PTS sugar transporter subunit IIA [Carnobacterium maltaromaticum]|uniref:PTS sugar transporter subunit IIA n=1 Tax=Carnobacterium maltaromaticum TaxID=2751 RepID=UPI000C787DD9|nr:PTS sugar transporter subunit IIA [Carnobacterium maltaromaticum]PLS35233.1 PTS sugar transporter subunit IIA [Carnobacterium maltaromaticum]PLS35646.1 PTS sugar transporter subunit IIA [Carnobacterium maltaromaticum]PLS36096.1 PTS sugar transporter subunit IIA [Carnobacterium maltaromaticum]PLS42553.1 PTS sugar transporter subunit IIA [Carnobacterium maltaromaticum]PLS45574.1 PTS sugar transporter subunit IIA [Carnobacterium maltaromaticum]
MSIKELFQPELIDLQMQANSEEELFAVIAERLLELGYVYSDYLTGITLRERNFPTGLITQHLNIALPHSDTEYVKKPFIYIVRLKQPVIVRQMGDNQEMLVKDIFFLGIKEPSKQVGLLQLLITLFQEEAFMEALQNVEESEAMYALFITKLAEMEEERVWQKS